jgi:hypothetical protein
MSVRTLIVTVLMAAAACWVHGRGLKTNFSTNGSSLRAALPLRCQLFSAGAMAVSRGFRVQRLERRPCLCRPKRIVWSRRREPSCSRNYLVRPLLGTLTLRFCKQAADQVVLIRHSVFFPEKTYRN